jgi:hypothetical protein
MTTELCKILVSVVLTAALASPGMAATVSSFIDQDFNDADWQAVVIYHNNPNAEGKGWQVTSAGNPDKYRRAKHEKYGGSFSGANGKIHTAHVNTNASFATTLAPGAWVRFSYDLTHFLPHPDQQAVYYAPLIKQDDKYYVAEGVDITDEKWKNETTRLLGASDFWLFPADAKARQHPEFSCGGSAIQFGYVTINSHSNASQVRESGIDNWKVEFYPPVAPDFTLTATLPAGNDRFTVIATSPPSALFPNDLGFYWDVVEVTPNGTPVPGTLVENPSQWWADSTFNTFKGYDSTSNYPPTNPVAANFPGLFKANHIYRITRAIWGPCTPWTITRKKIFICTDC